MPSQPMIATRSSYRIISLIHFCSLREEATTMREQCWMMRQELRINNNSNTWYLCGTESKLAQWLRLRQYRKDMNLTVYYPRPKTLCFKFSLQEVLFAAKSCSEAMSSCLTKLQIKKFPKAKDLNLWRIILILLQQNRSWKLIKPCTYSNGSSLKA